MKLPAQALLIFAGMANAECQRTVNGTQVPCQTDFSFGMAIAGYATMGLLAAGALSYGLYKLYQCSKKTSSQYYSHDEKLLLS